MRRSRHGRHGPVRAAELLGRLLDRRGVSRELEEQRILVHWAEIVGPVVAARAWPDGLDKGVLWVQVASAPWLHQLSFLKDEIRQRANGLAGAELVSEVRFHVGGRQNPGKDDVIFRAARIHRRPAEDNPPPPPPQGERLRQLEREAEAIGDEELRRIVLEVRRRWDR